MTPEEIDRAQWAAFKLREQELRGEMRQAWMTVHLSRTNKLPSLRLWLDPVINHNTPDELARRAAEHEQMLREFNG
jgi:hypothetical protein